MIMAKTAKEKVSEKPQVKPVEKTEEEFTIEQKLKALYALQQIDSNIDRIRIVKGELPLEVQDLEDEVAGLETRIGNYQDEIEKLEKQIADKQIVIKDSQALIKKYEAQQMEVRNNREYDSLTKEIEFQNLEIQLGEKRIKEATFKLEAVKAEIEKSKELLEERKKDLEIKKGELADIIADTEKEENELLEKSQENEKYIEERLLTAYQRIRKNARNGLAVVQVERDACGGCFNKIPPQVQLDIRMHKKIIVCEYCGRILVDQEIADMVNETK
jgi:predicted  nucleic acid-binding Zn-ribbon protein